MQKIGDTTKTADSNGEFTDGDPQKQTPPTWIMAAWLNTLQREVIKVVQEGGLTLNPKDDTQLYQAIDKLIGTAVKGALPLYSDTLAVDLNTLGAADQAGVYCQPQNAGATTANHYPINVAGTLLVTPSAYGCQQEYTTYSTRQKFVRGLTGPWNGKDGPWSDWAAPPAYGWGMGPQHRDDAYNNTAMIYRVNGTSVNAPGPNVYGVISLPCDGGPSTAYLALQNSGRAFVGYSGVKEKGITWTEVYTVKNPPPLPTAEEINALPLTGGTMGGEIKSTSANILRGIQDGYGQIIRMDANALYFLQTNANDPNGNYNSNRSLTISNSGSVSIGTSLSVDSPNSIYKTGINSYSNEAGSYHQTNGMAMQGVGDQVGEMYFLENIGKYAALGLHVRSGNRDAWVEFRNDGDFYINGTNAVPVGVIEAWPSDTPPTGWLMCDGSGFNTGIFPSLARIFPSGHLPDLRGAFLRAKDNGKGVDPNRTLLSIQPGQAPASAIGGGEWDGYAGRDTGHTVGTGSDNTYTYHVKQETEAQRETRPYNVAINYIVRAA